MTAIKISFNSKVELYRSINELFNSYKLPKGSCAYFKKNITLNGGEFVSQQKSPLNEAFKGRKFKLLTQLQYEHELEKINSSLREKRKKEEFKNSIKEARKIPELPTEFNELITQAHGLPESKIVAMCYLYFSSQFEKQAEELELKYKKEKEEYTEKCEARSSEVLRRQMLIANASKNEALNKIREEVEKFKIEQDAKIASLLISIDKKMGIK